MNRKIRSICWNAAFGSALSLVGVSAQALTNAVATGAWDSAATWDAGVPAIGNSAIINGSQTVTLSTASEADLIDLGTIAGETGTLQINAGTDLYIANAVGPGDFPSSIRIGQAAGSTGHLTMNGGSVYVDGLGGWAVGDVMVGDAGTGVLTMAGGEMSINHELAIGFLASASGTVNASGGTLRTVGQNILLGWDGTAALNISGDAVVRSADWLFASFWPTANAAINQTGGTLNVAHGFALGRQGNASYEHSSGTMSAELFLIADNVDPGPPENIRQINVTYNMSGDAVANVVYNTVVGVSSGGVGTVNQTGGTLNTAGMQVGAGGRGTWNISGGVINQTGTNHADNNFLVGRIGFGDRPGWAQGVVNQTGGEVNVATNVFLGDFDHTFGEYRVAGGTLDVTGNFNIGGALASNAPADADRLEPSEVNGAQGQAANANGTLVVRGSAAEISIGGNLLANPADKSAYRSGPNLSNSATLGFEILDSSGVSLVSVAGVADLDGAVIDLDLIGGYLPNLGSTFDLITASSFGSTGTGTTQNVGTGKGFTLAAEDNGVFSLAVVSGGLGEILRATLLSAPTLLGDYNSNGVVDAADYTVWRDNPAAHGGAGGYDVWANNYGATSGSTSVAVPEPAACVTVMLGSLATLLCRRNRG